MENHGFFNNLTKPPVARKLAVRHISFVCLTASFQETGGFRFKLFHSACMVYKHAIYICCCILHLCSAW